jgi:hypothetical protein
MRVVPILLFCAGCLEPLVSDEPGASTHILPPGSFVAHVSTDADLSRQIRVNDGLQDQALLDAGGVVKLKSGFAAGVAVSYWDFGDVAPNGALLYRLVSKDAGGTVTPLAHAYIASAIPGDPGYSPMWMVQDVVVTDKYHGEVLPSIEAISDAVDLGMVEDPVPAALFMDGPIVPQGTLLDMGMDRPAQPTLEIYAHGLRVDMFALGGSHALQPMSKPGRIPRGDAHMLLIGNAVNPQKAPLFQNLSSPWTPAVRPINCRITPPDPADPTTVVVDEAQLFTRDMMGQLAQATARVISWQMTTTTKNWPILWQETP